MITFQSLHNDFSLKGKREISRWIKNVALAEGKRVRSLAIVFCDDNYLSNLNIKFLKHKTLTDIITFDYEENTESITADLIISIDRVIENAQKYKVSERTEMLRVIIHGVLHLCGYSDKKRAEINLMRQKEDYYLMQYTSK